MGGAMTPSEVAMGDLLATDPTKILMIQILENLVGNSAAIMQMEA
jgi:hypothetical protein